MNCPKCGAVIDPNSKFCSACGAALSEDQPIESTGSDNVPISSVEVIPTSSTPTAKFNNKRIILFIAILLLLLVGAGFLFQRNKGPNFKKLYDEYCQSTWADVGSDGSYLSIDTNPFDEDDNGLAYPAAYRAIKNINDALGLPDSLINDMGSTTSIDGKQSETFDEIQVTVSWRYHPDKGLEVSYKKSK